MADQLKAFGCRALLALATVASCGGSVVFDGSEETGGDGDALQAGLEELAQACEEKCVLENCRDGGRNYDECYVACTTWPAPECASEQAGYVRCNARCCQGACPPEDAECFDATGPASACAAKYEDTTGPTGP